MGKLDWGQIMKDLKCEAKLFGFLFGRQGTIEGSICVWLYFGWKECGVRGGNLGILFWRHCGHGTYLR